MDCQAAIEMTKAKDVIAELSLSSLDFGNYLVIVKSDFDIIIAEEPYLALMLLLDVRTGKYLARIWNQTVTTGIVTTPDQLKAAFMTHFEHRPCLGCPEGANDKTQFDFLISQTPIPRRISKACHKVLRKGVNSDDLSSCQECIKLKDTCKSGGVQIEAGEVAKAELLQETDFKEECEDMDSLNPNGLEISKRCDKELSEDYGDQQKEHHLNGQDDSINEDIYDSEQEITGENATHQVDGLKVDEGETSDGKSSEKNIFNSNYNKENAKIHHARGDKKFKCEECLYATAFKAILKRHMRNVHKKIIIDICNKCGYVASCKDTLKQHMMSVHNKKIICKQCPYTTTHKCRMAEHMQGKHKMGDKKFRCEHCPYVAYRKSHLKKHVDGVHENIRNHLCEECGYAALYKRGLYIHKELMHNIGDKKFKCEKCPYATALKGNLKIHVAGVHDNIRKHTCEICGYAAKHKPDLKRHIKGVHGNIRDNVCEECGNAFSQKSSLNRHMVSVHNIGDKKIRTKKEALEAHERMHVGEKPFPCSICETGLTSKKGLTQHMSSVHKIATHRGRKVGWHRKGKQSDKG